MTTLDINSSSTDVNSQSYYSGSAIGGHFFDFSGTSFFTPDSTYTGYAVNGYYYASGVLNNTLRASWAEEGDDTVNPSRDPAVRNAQDSFPDAVFIFYSETEVTIVDSITLAVWMKFNISTLPSMSAAKIIKAKMAAGVLCVLAQQNTQTDASSFLLTYNFRRDCITVGTSGTYYLREKIKNRNETGAYGSLSVDHDLSAHITTANSYPSGQVYDLDVNFVGNNVRALVGGLGFFIGINTEAHTETVGSFDYKAPLYKVHSATKTLTINTVNVSLADITQLTSGITSVWSLFDATNNFSSLNIVYGDVIKISGSSNTSYFTLDETVSSGQTSYRIKTILDNVKYEAISKDFPGWKNVTPSSSYLDIKTDLESTNTYQVLRPIPFVRIQVDGTYLISSSFFTIHKTSATSITDHSSVTQYDLFVEPGSLLTGYESKSLDKYKGIAESLEDVFFSFEDEILSVKIDDITANNPASSLTTVTTISSSISSSANINTLGKGMVIDPLSGNLFIGGLKSSDNFSYLIEISQDGVTLSCSAFKEQSSSASPAEEPIIMDGYSNPSGTEV